jgi:2-aminoadipate transaminase
MFYKAIERKVAYVVGSAFYFDEAETNSMRINFSYSTFEQIEEGVKRLAVTIQEEIEAHEAGPRGQTVPEDM